MSLTPTDVYGGERVRIEQTELLLRLILGQNKKPPSKQFCAITPTY
jgi:hypothetical protein